MEDRSIDRGDRRCQSPNIPIDVHAIVITLPHGGIAISCCERRCHGSAWIRRHAAPMLRPMRCDTRELLAVATAIDALVGRLAPGAPSLTAASRHELALLRRVLDEGGAPDVAREHLARLD